MSRAWPVPNIKPKQSVAKNANRILSVRLDELFSYSQNLPDPDAVAELHNARIAAKRLRYTLELFPALIGKAGAAAIEQLKGIQNDLGIIHDLDVRMDLIANEIETLADATDEADVNARDGLESLLKRQRASRNRLHRTFVKNWQRLEESDFRGSLVNAT